MTPSPQPVQVDENPAGATPEKLFANRSFRLVFTAALGSKLGIQVSYIAIPLLAVLTLHATPGQVGLLGVMSTICFLIIGLPAGAWVERLAKRRVQIAADLVRGVLIGSVPLAWLLHVMTIEQLYVVVLLSGAATVFFDVSAQSYLPSVVGREALVAANSQLVSMDALNIIAGRSIGGFLVQLLGAPLAVLFNAITFFWSASCLALIRKQEIVEPRKPGRRLWHEVHEGLRFVFGNPLLRPIALTGALNNLSVQISVVMFPVLLTSVLGFSAATVGLFLSTGGIGVFLGTLIARRIGGLIGYGRAMWVFGMVTVPFKLTIPFVGHGPMPLN